MEKPTESIADTASPRGPAEERSAARSTEEQPFRWKTGLSILLAGLVVQQILWRSFPDDSTRQIEATWYVYGTTFALLSLWWVLLSGLRWKVRLRGMAAGAALAAVFMCVFRFDGYTGDFVPQFSLRTSPSPEALAATYRVSQSAKAASGSTSPKAVAPGTISGDNWPQFRGPRHDGTVRGQSIRRNWQTNPPQLVWKHPVGEGWSSFAIVGRLAYTQEQRGAEEAVVCYDALTGDEIWSHADTTRFSSVMGGDGPRGTPTVSDSRVYALGGTGILNCLEMTTGRVLWSRNTVEDARTSVISWGMSGSPLVYDNLVVVNPGGGQGREVAAYERLTGEIVWTGGNERCGYATPRLANLAGLRQVLIFDAEGVAGFDAEAGRELWRFPWTNGYHNNCAQPIVTDEGLVFISSGYGTGSALLEIQKTADGYRAISRWEAPNRFKLKFNDGVYRDGHVYGLDVGILACLDLSTGKIKWKQGRYGFGQVLLLDDVLLVAAESGEVALVEISPDEPGREITRFQAIEGKTWNHPVLHSGRLYVRNAQEAACYDVSGVGNTP